MEICDLKKSVEYKPNWYHNWFENIVMKEIVVMRA